MRVHKVVSKIFTYHTTLHLTLPSTYISHKHNQTETNSTPHTKNMGMEKEQQQELEHEQFIFRSPLPDIYIPYHLSIHEFCFQNLQNHHSNPALINASNGQVFTHADVNILSRRLASGLHHKLGIRQGQVIMIVLHNSPEFAFSFLASSFLGAITTTANPHYASQELVSQAKISKPTLIITHGQYIDKVNEYASKNGVKIVSVESDFPELTKFHENLLPKVEFSSEETAMLPFSSGTTGLPKGVMLSHKNVVACVARKVDGENPAIFADQKDLTLCVLPLFHVFSLMAVLLSGLRAGSSVLIVPKYEIHELMGLIKKYRVTIAPLVPPILLAMKQAATGKNTVDMSSVRRVMSGAAPMDGKLESSVRAMFPNAVIGQGYGMTEAGVLTTCLGFAKRPLRYKSGSCGTVIRNSEMKIVDPVTGVSLPRNKTGEICVRNEQIMKGYLNDPEATKRMIDKDGWLHSGDIGYVDDDNQVFIVDRLKELIKYKGFHIAPAQLEALLLAHANISDAAVVPMKDEVAGEVPVAFVVRSNGSNISEQEIKKYISKQVVSYKRLSRVFFISQIPKAPSGKILRKNLRAKI